MAREPRPQSIDISNVPELLRIAEEVRKTRTPRVLRRDGEELGVLVPPPAAPIRPARASVRGHRRYLTPEDSFWDIVGMSDTPAGPRDVAEHKHRYLAEAYTPKAE